MFYVSYIIATFFVKIRTQDLLEKHIPPPCTAFISSDMKRFITFIVFSLLCLAVAAQTVKNSGYRTIGYVDGIPVKWAAAYFFFRE